MSWKNRLNLILVCSFLKKSRDIFLSVLHEQLFERANVLSQIFSKGLTKNNKFLVRLYLLKCQTVWLTHVIPSSFVFRGDFLHPVARSYFVMKAEMCLNLAGRHCPV